MATTDALISLDDVHRARERIGDRLHRTPLLTSATLSRQVGADVRFKAELLQDAPEADVILVQVGGGGLVSGITTAVKGMKSGVRVVAIEPERSPALHESLKAGEPVTVEPKSIADGLNGPYAGANCVRVCTELGVESVLVTEDALKEAFVFMYGRMKLACEVAGAATARALPSGIAAPEPGQTVAAVVSGGNVAPETAAAILNSDEA